jgi:hypothetical protein
MATVGADSAYATDIIAVQRVFYNQKWSFLCKHFYTFDFPQSLNENQFY